MLISRSASNVDHRTDASTQRGRAINSRNIDRITIHDGDACTGPIPAELGALRALKWLDLSSNQLSGEQSQHRGADKQHITNDVHGTAALVIDPPASANCPTSLVSIRPSNIQRDVFHECCFLVSLLHPATRRAPL